MVKNKYMSIFNSPLWIVRPLSKIFKLFPRVILSLRYFKLTHRFINWRHPRNIQEYEFCQLFDKNTNISLFAQLADKVKVRSFVEERIGSQYLTQLFDTWESPFDISFEKLPNTFVLKTNNGCGNNIIVKNKYDVDKADVIKKLSYWIKFPYGDLTGQIHYSMIKPLILAESYLRQSHESDILPYDYKFFCYKGYPKYILYYEGRSLNGHITPNMLFDTSWTAIPQAVIRPLERKIPKPSSFDEMLECVKRLCVGFDFVRVDFYEINNRPVFGEMTFTPDILDYVRQDYKDLMEIHKL